MEQISIENEQLKPSIRKYFSGSKFLTDYYNYRKQSTDQFSYEVWTIELGLKSKSTLRMIVRGERVITENFVELFSKFEKLDPTDKEYFLVLAKSQNTKNIAMKKFYLDKLAELSICSIPKAEIKNVQLFLSDLNLMKTQVLIAYTDFEATEKNIRHLLDLNKHETQKILKTLEAMGLIQATESEAKEKLVWKTTSKFFSVTDEAHREAMNLYHRSTMHESLKAISLQETYQKFKSLNLALSDSDFIELNEMLSLFSNKLKNKYGDGPLKTKRLFKINLQAYPVSKKLE